MKISYLAETIKSHAMNRRTLILLILTGLIPTTWFSSCNRVKQLAAFDVIYTIPETHFIYTPSGSEGTGELLYSGAIEANLDSILSANGFSAGVIGNTRFIECSISIVEPSAQNFGWLQSARGEISVNQDFNPAQEVGQVTNNDPLATTVHLILNSMNIRPYLGARFFYFRVFGTLNGPLPVQWVEMALNGKLRMHLEPLN